MIAFLAFVAAAAPALASEPSGVVDVQLTGGVLVPVSHTGSVSVGALSIGTWIREDMAVRLRLLGSPPPVPEDGTVSDAWTWGVMSELQKNWGLHPRLDPFWTGSMGFVASDQTASARTNLAAFALHTALGFSARLHPDEGMTGWTLAPVIGVAPQLFGGDGLVSLVGPTAAVRIGRAW